MFIPWARSSVHKNRVRRWRCVKELRSQGVIPLDYVQKIVVHQEARNIKPSRRELVARDARKLNTSTLSYLEGIVAHQLLGWR